MVPRVVGTVSSAGYLSDLAKVPRDRIPCDWVEVRFDGMLDHSTWQSDCQSLEAKGIPVLFTLRLENEGGRWTAKDAERVPVFEQALKIVSAIDVEFRSPQARRLAALARDAEKVAIISYHDFQRTPDHQTLRAVVEKSQEFADIVKVTTMIRERDDLRILLGLLREKWGKPMSIFGMGQLGTVSRTVFCDQGSCLTYGFLDAQNAPGQLRASSLVEYLRTVNSKYNQERGHFMSNLPNYSDANSE